MGVVGGETWTRYQYCQKWKNRQKVGKNGQGNIWAVEQSRKGGNFINAYPILGPPGI